VLPELESFRVYTPLNSMDQILAWDKKWSESGF